MDSSQRETRTKDWVNDLKTHGATTSGLTPQYIKMDSSQRETRTKDWVNDLKTHGATTSGLIVFFIQGILDVFKQLCVAFCEKASHSHNSRLFSRAFSRLLLWSSNLQDENFVGILATNDGLKSIVVDGLIRLSQLLYGDLVSSTLVKKEELKPRFWKDISGVKETVDSFVLSQPQEANEAEYSVALDPEEYTATEIDEAHELVEAIVFEVEELTELVPTITQRYLHLQRLEHARKYSTVVTTNDFSTTGPAQLWIQRVLERYKQIDVKLAERLGRANWEQFERLRAIVSAADSAEESKSEAPVHPQSSDIVFAPLSKFHDSGIGTSVPTLSHRAPSVTSVSTVSVSNRFERRIPPMPIEVSEGQGFRCRYCCRFLEDIKNRKDWQRHVFADIQPYICTFGDCDQRLTTFSTRDQWATHEFTAHRAETIWRCLKCPKTLLTGGSLEQHMISTHEDFANHEDVAGSIALSQEPKDLECRLCMAYTGRSRKLFVKHVCHHMEGLASAIFPEDEEEDQTDDDLDTLAIPERNAMDIPWYDEPSNENDTNPEIPTQGNVSNKASGAGEDHVLQSELCLDIPCKSGTSPKEGSLSESVAATFESFFSRSREPAIQIRHVTEAKWQQHRATIEELYRDVTLKKVMHIMKDQHNFQSTVSMYRSYLRKWGTASKHLSKDEKAAMLCRVRSRKELRRPDTSEADNLEHVPKPVLKPVGTGTNVLLAPETEA